MSGAILARRANWKLAVILGLATILIVSLIPRAQADPVKEIELTVDPAVVVDGSTVDFKARVDNLETNNAPVGALMIVAPTNQYGDFVITEANNGEELLEFDGKTWTVSYTATEVTLEALTQSDRLGPGDSLSLDITADIPDLNLDTNDIDVVFGWGLNGRQANTFNDQNGGNDFTQTLSPRDEAVVLRDGSGLSSSSLYTNETLVVSGTAVDCSNGPCEGADTQTATTVTIKAEGCTSGTLVVDATDLGLGEVGAAAWYTYLDGLCTEGSTVTVDIVYDKSLGVKKNDVWFATDYGDKDISAFDPYYVGDLVPLPDCDGTHAVNCVSELGTVPGGHLHVQLKMLLTDPGGAAFR